MATSSIIPENERPNYVKPEFLKKVAPLDPVQWLPQVKAQHIRIQDITDDTITPKAAQARIEAAAPVIAKLQRYQSTREFFGAASGGKVFQWVKDQIRGIPETKPEVQNTLTLQPAAPVAEKHDD